LEDLEIGYDDRLPTSRAINEIHLDLFEYKNRIVGTFVFDARKFSMPGRSTSELLRTLLMNGCF